VPSVATSPLGPECVAFSACRLRAVVTDPPRGITAVGSSIVVRLIGAPFMNTGSSAVQVRFTRERDHGSSAKEIG
jgi:hypothetical protein